MDKADTDLSTTVEHIREGLVASPVADLKLAMTWSVTIDDDIASGVIRVAEDGEDTGGTGVSGRCDVIAMATHGLSGLQRWAMGSVTERVLQATRLPLLIVRPPEVMEKNIEPGTGQLSSGRVLYTRPAESWRHSSTLKVRNRLSAHPRFSSLARLQGSTRSVGVAEQQALGILETPSDS